MSARVFNRGFEQCAYQHRGPQVELMEELGDEYVNLQHIGNVLFFHVAKHVDEPLEVLPPQTCTNPGCHLRTGPPVGSSAGPPSCSCTGRSEGVELAVFEGCACQTHPLAGEILQVGRSVELDLDHVRGQKFGFENIKGNVSGAHTDYLLKNHTHGLEATGTLLFPSPSLTALGRPTSNSLVLYTFFILFYSASYVIGEAACSHVHKVLHRLGGDVVEVHYVAHSVQYREEERSASRYFVELDVGIQRYVLLDGELFQLRDEVPGHGEQENGVAEGEWNFSYLSQEQALLVGVEKQLQLADELLLAANRFEFQHQVVIPLDGFLHYHRLDVFEVDHAKTLALSSDDVNDRLRAELDLDQSLVVGVQPLMDHHGLDGQFAVLRLQFLLFDLEASPAAILQLDHAVSSAGTHDGDKAQEDTGVDVHKLVAL
ncbi:hypothetical protein YQE_09880, partial [Dendroctonus ponderosae]